MSQVFVIRTLWALGFLALLSFTGCTVISKAPELRACQAQRAKLQQEIQVYSIELNECGQDVGKLQNAIGVCIEGLKADVKEFNRIGNGLDKVEAKIMGSIQKFQRKK